MQFFTLLGLIISIAAGLVSFAFLVHVTAKWVVRKLDKTSPNALWVNFHKDFYGHEYITAYTDEDMARKVSGVRGKSATLRYVRD